MSNPESNVPQPGGPASNGVVAEFFEAWSRALARALSEAGLASPKIELLDAKAATDAVARAGEKKFRVAFNGGGRLSGTMALLTSQPEALQFGQVQLAEPADRSGEFNDAHRHAAAELIRKAAGYLAAASETDAKGKSELAPAETPGADSEAIRGGLHISADKFAEVSIALALSADFAESLKTNAAEGGDTAVPEIAPGPASNLDLLFDVQLEATIRFGERQLLLREVLALSPGAVIELDRQIHEPAELLVAGRLVARGEVVVVEGSFALRVTELINQGQRAELLQA